MPVHAAQTATQQARDAWENAQPGDIFFTSGGGLVGAIVEHGTDSPYGHCGILHEYNLNTGYWKTAEAFPAMPPWKPGLRYRTRTIDSIAALVRVWRTGEEQNAILTESTKLVSEKLPYAWSEIALIAASMIIPQSWIPTGDLTQAVICSNHVAQCIRAARPGDYDTYFRYPPNLMWPGGVHYDLQAMLWDDQHS